MRKTDCTIVGASFAGLACATTLARAGMNVAILEKKSDKGVFDPQTPAARLGDVAEVRRSAR